MSMRNWSKCILTVAILFISVTIPSVGGAAGDLGFAEDVETLSGSSIGWANLGNGDVAIVNETGNNILTCCELIERRFADAHVLCLSGPNLYSSLDNKDLSEATIGVNDLETGILVKKLFNNDFFKTQITIDRVGVELCGIFKNIIAIGVGFLGNKPNSVALLIRKGLNEMYKLSLKLRKNVSKDTFYEFSCGIGDLYLTSVYGRGRKLARSFSDCEHLDLNNWNILEKFLYPGMKIPDHHTVNLIGKLIEKNGWIYEFPIFYNIYKIAWTNDSKESLEYLKRNL